MKRHGTLIKEYVDQWNLEGTVVDKIEELIWITVTIYGVGGYSSNTGFIPNFFLYVADLFGKAITHLTT
jgi:hypothetical protein